MNDKLARQVEEMKKQTIGVELEMSNITRQKTPRWSPDTSAPRIR